MNIDSKVGASVGAALAALDFSPENARIAEIEADIARMEAARETAQARRAEISETLAPYRTQHSLPAATPFADNGAAVADALLAELDPTEAASAHQTTENLEREREALMLGMKDLASRINGGRQEISDIRAGTCQRVAREVMPAMDAILSDAQDLARKLVESFAAMKAIAMAGRVGGARIIALENALHEGVFGQHCLLPYNNTIEVPPSVVEMLSVLANKGVALKAPLVTAVSPDRYIG
jgi:multidrug efflux pump subunit AcrA (membrane-fusion protein)